MNEGWVKIHRQILDHWLYNEPRPHTRREAWEDIILLSNHTDTKVLISGELIDCKRGQSVMSLKSWAMHFKWSIQQVRTFFKLLENDSMIEIEGLRKTTRITVCKYEDYQNIQQTNNTQKTRKQHGDNNKQECKECKEGKELYMKARVFYESQLEESKNNPLFDQFIKILFGESGAGIRCDGILNMDQQVTWVQFQTLVDKAKAKGVKLSDLIYDFENGGYFKGKKSLYLSLNNWINRR